jgi:hypothetical protein
MREDFVLYLYILLIIVIYNLEYNNYNIFIEDDQILEFFDRKINILQNEENLLNWNSTLFLSIVKKY